jgi:hypothetical protein
MPLAPSPSSEMPMSDMYIYYFTESTGPYGENALSARPGTLKAIKGRGEPVMASQIVVDHTELDEDGYLVPTLDNASHSSDDLASQIASLEVRAASRDREAIDCSDGVEKYMLSLESRELRKQARKLKSPQSALVANEFASCGDMARPMHLELSPATGY